MRIERCDIYFVPLGNHTAEVGFTLEYIFSGFTVRTSNMASSSKKRSFDPVLERVCAIHKIDSLKELQTLCLKLLTVNRKDVMACLPTGYGKSLIYQAWPTVCDLLSGNPENTSIVLVVCPLLAIMKEQVTFLKTRQESIIFDGVFRDMLLTGDIYMRDSCC